MEDLFAPTTRFRDLYRARERDRFFDYVQRQIDAFVELELITGSSVEDTFLHCGFTWNEFYSWARGKIVWISPQVFFDLSRFDTGLQTDYHFFLEVTIEPNEDDTRQKPKRLYVCASSEAHATIASDILLQLLTTCESHKVEIRKGFDSDRFPVSGLAFSHFLAQSRNLRALDVRSLGLNTCHCRAIYALSRTDLQIELIRCEMTGSGEEIILECIRQNRGPTALHACQIDTRRLADALRGNNSVTMLALDENCSDDERLVLVQALAENEGLVALYLRTVLFTDEMWIALWRSVARHPKLEEIWLPDDGIRTRRARDGDTDAHKTLRMQAMVDALRVNTVLLHAIELNRDNFDEEMLDNTVYPLLLANKYRPRVGAITEEEVCCVASRSGGLWPRYPVTPL
jgi:hypothetical protein